MEREEFIIVYRNGEIERFHGTSNEVFNYAMSKSEKFAFYTRDEYESEFGPLEESDTRTHLQKKMESAGEPRVVSKDEAEPEKPQDPYRQTIIDSFQHLQEFGDQVFSQALNLAMQNEWQDINEQFDDHETLNFGLEDLAQLHDPNVQKLVTLIYRIDETMASLENINDLSDEEKGSE